MGLPATPAEAAFSILPHEKTADQEFNFGATATGLDVNDISASNVEKLRTAIWTHKVVTVKGQKNLDPKKHWELVTRLDPDAPQVHSHGDVATFNKKGGVLTKGRPIIGIPGAENVRLIGKGYQGDDHYGIKNLTIEKCLTHLDFHAEPQANGAFGNGHTRFQRWHIDAPLYGRDPAWFTTLRAVKLPSAESSVKINWDDGSGYSMSCPPGLTAFFSTSQLYNMLSEEEQRMADHSWVEYAPHPYMWISDCKANSNGLGLKSEGKEKSIDELGEYDEKDIKKYPLVWLNPITNEKAFQVHGICARKLFLRSSPQETPTIISDIPSIRDFLSNIQRRILKPQYIYLPEIEEGDIVMWDNYGLFHSAVDYPDRYGSRSMHQANIGASAGPRGPVSVPGDFKDLEVM